ncbi:phosphate ABC transporter substrate-binding protein PstS [Cellulomonas carbonis]|uniref:Phosphate-binding protein n=1 Tax=Cellulomonas carbonis T26 TaxID=947969 RepID=A0A0A0BT97_9CELL|nr:phosphate ABC transporter substrate-binding protein PstS [Cellulomonas carbonis]KGM11150.1 phosphate ABC transporter substrate-binding protein [Cellulomonas carbonis T26]GGC05108.1 phosphate-binding protein PstS [Cellulomonas carbonis]
MRHDATRGTALAAAAAVLLLAGCGSDDPVNHPWRPGGAPTDAPAEAPVASDLSGSVAGAGASSQESAMQAWVAGFQSANPDVSVAYDPVGSGGGRTQFVEGGVAFAGSDAPLDEEELAAAQERCAPGEVVEAPLYISPIAVVFNLEGVDSLAMSPATVAGIFAGTITRWDAPEIAAENPDVALPDLGITPVNRSDESGTTENFTEYLHATAPEAWPHEPSGDWPVSGGQSAQGNSGVVQTVTDGTGTITYADASKAGSLGTVRLGVGDEFVEFSPEAAAAVVDASPRAEGRPATSFVVELDRTTTAPGAYPLVLISYTLACTAYEDPATGELVSAFLSYVAGEAGQAAAADTAGSAPVSDALRSEVLPVLEGIG